MVESGNLFFFNDLSGDCDSSFENLYFVICSEFSSGKSNIYHPQRALIIFLSTGQIEEIETDFVERYDRKIEP